MTEQEGFPASGNDGKRKKAKGDYALEAQQNLMRIVEYMETDVLRPISTKDLCIALDLTPNKVTWALYNLRMRGWAEQVGDQWRLGQRVGMIAESVRNAHSESLQKYLG
ncbi:MAG: hypothetical protein OHK006_12860 [Thermodesulfovibrionales bacterium]